MAVSLPKQWEDWCSWLLGLWLCISPWALLFDLDSTATKIAVISGILVILADAYRLSPMGGMDQRHTWSMADCMPLDCWRQLIDG
jgi:hypothetical protein